MNKKIAIPLSALATIIAMLAILVSMFLLINTALNNAIEYKIGNGNILNQVHSELHKSSTKPDAPKDRMIFLDNSHVAIY